MIKQKNLDSDFQKKLIYQLTLIKLILFNKQSLNQNEIFSILSIIIKQYT